MRCVAHHVLIYLCSVQLLLPGGWCCAALLALTASTERPDEPPTEACCCCRPKPAQTPDSHSSPSPAHPKSPVKPCCIEKAALPSTIQHLHFTSELPALAFETIAALSREPIEM